MNDIDSGYLKAKIKEAFDEDLATVDITTEALFPEPFVIAASITAKESGVLAGGEVVRHVFHYLSDKLTVDPLLPDGTTFTAGTTVISITGDGRKILQGERIALNFLGYLSGIATLTHAFVKRLNGTKAKILDTRKTHPGLRPLEKFAVRMGGGMNHRFGLYDRYLIKDNHLISIQDIGAAIDCCHEHRKKHNTNTLIEVEVEDLAGVRSALQHKADIILLDNMPVKEMKEAVEFINGKAKVEASGGVTLETVADIAQTGVDYISVGALTHSAKSIDFSMEFKKL